MKEKIFLSKFDKRITISVIVILILRLFLNAVIPLMDKTEARYGEIARIMAETNNWITPQVDYGFPFWAKPPMSTWFSALSIRILGVSEFAARFPAFIITILIFLLTGKYARQKGLPFFLPGFILLMLPLFLIHVGVVSTDMTLLLCITLVMLSFWEAMNQGKNYWKYVFFIGVGLGLLAKGPIILVLTGPPLFIWLIWFKKFGEVWKKLPWISGILIVLIIAAPWYYFAEKTTPGFLEYFFVGEHFKRFFDSTWDGDKYGFEQEQKFGTIWLFLLATAFPWVIFVFAKLWKTKREIKSNPWVIFLILWMFWSPFFFTFSKSYIYTYNLPDMIPIALFVVYYWKNIPHRKVYTSLGLILPVASIFLVIMSFVPGIYPQYANTDKYLLERNYRKELPIFFYHEKSYSSMFYTHGKIKEINVQVLIDKITQNRSFQIIIDKEELADINPDILKKLKFLDSNKKHNIYQFN